MTIWLWDGDGVKRYFLNLWFMVWMEAQRCKMKILSRREAWFPKQVQQPALLDWAFTSNNTVDPQMPCNLWALWKSAYEIEKSAWFPAE